MLEGQGNVGVQLLPLRRQPRAPVGADEQLAAQRRFQVLDGPRNVGLVAAQDFRRLGKALISGRVVKNPIAVIADIHVVHHIFLIYLKVLPCQIMLHLRSFYLIQVQIHLY